jgi:hypothetical protein
MPTVNPRINVTLSPSLNALVGQLASLTRVSKSQVLRELLEAAEPALQRAVALMGAAKGATAAAMAGLADRLQRDQDAAEDSAALVLARLDRVTGDLVGQAEAVRGKRPSRAAPRRAIGLPTRGVALNRPSDPPISNRGVKSTKDVHRRRGPGSKK